MQKPHIPGIHIPHTAVCGNRKHHSPGSGHLQAAPPEGVIDGPLGARNRSAPRRRESGRGGASRTWRGVTTAGAGGVPCAPSHRLSPHRALTPGAYSSLRRRGVFDGVFWPHWNGFYWPHFWAVWVTSQGGAGEERFGVAPLLDRVTFRRCLEGEAIRSRCSDCFQHCALGLAQPVEVPLCEGHRFSVAAEERCEVGVVHPTV